MPRYRQLHTKIINSFDFNEMPDDFTRVVWLLMTLILDSEGRGIDNANWIRSNMFPLRDDISTDQIERAFKWLADKKMIVRYTVNGRNYFHIPTFKNYQSGTKKEAASLLPAPLLTSSGLAPEEGSAAESASASESALNTGDVFKAYEGEIGIISPAIRDKMKVYFEDNVPLDYFIMAFKEAASHNARSWAYAEKIIKRLQKEGMKFKDRDNSKPKKFEEVWVKGELKMKEVAA